MSAASILARLGRNLSQKKLSLNCTEALGLSRNMTEDLTVDWSLLILFFFCQCLVLKCP